MNTSKTRMVGFCMMLFTNQVRQHIHGKTSQFKETEYKKRWEDAAEALLEHINPMTPGQAACEAYWKDRIESSGWGKYSTQAKELWESIAVAGHEQIKKLEENNDT